MNHNHRNGETVWTPLGDFTYSRPHNRNREMNATKTVTANQNGRISLTIVERLLQGRTHYFSEIVHVTPQMALEILTNHNNLNRTLYEGKSIFYASEMTNGYWHRGTGAIGFDTAHELTNGQHRLRGQVIADVALDIPFVFNCDPESRASEDRHKPRSEADCLTLSGTEASGQIVATAKLFAKMPSSNNRTKSLESVRHVIAKYGHELTRAIQLSANDNGGLRHASIHACLARASLHAGWHRVSEFASIARSGVAESKDDQAAAKFYAWMRDGGRTLRGGSDMQRALLYQYTSAALRAFIERRTLTKLYAAESDLFPLRDE